ncbi:OLC1v1019258C1 [Oldenlandia corymbosa var. corymbosa]|uniref:OLC1v1019258C1 n=1 Tax=Oldenlandia corymbosa var. corymbosa TaxID=529605 RepID=A0AAV1EDM9_OLDCO|nr:OLC1v1019258C1 [Oldenlandia corymbosa var. corymbosa]
MLMEKEENYSAAAASIPGNFTGLLEYDDDSLDDHQQNPPQIIAGESSSSAHQMVDYMVHHNNNTDHHHQHEQHQQQPMSLSFADVMQFADFGPKLALNQGKGSASDHHQDQETGMDSVYFLKFPVLNERLQDNDRNQDSQAGGGLMMNPQPDEGGRGPQEAEPRPSSENNSVQLRFNVGENLEKSTPLVAETKNKRKRPRTIKTSEEVESQRMTHIAVERNRRKQMNEHLRVLRSLMPGSYVQRGDQASIIGGAIEFVRELEQLLQCLESQKRRRLYGDGSRPIGDVVSSSSPGFPIHQQPNQPPFFPAMTPAPLPLPLPLPPNDQMKLDEFEPGIQEETAESKSCLADVEVKLLGYDAVIKVLSRRRPGQLIKAIAALEDMQLNILHTNITTIEQTVLYSFNVKVGSEARFSAEDIANSIQQIFSFIHANSSI